MPNSRRRRFSVHNGIKGCKETSKNSTHSSSIDPTLDNNSQSVTTPKPDKPKIKSVPSNTTKTKRSLSIIGTNTSLASFEPIKKKRDTTTVDQNVTASASDIDLFNTINLTDEFFLEDIHERESSEEYKKPPVNYEYRRDRHVRHHRIKVRSPKRVPHDIQTKSLDIYKRNTGTVPIDWNQEMELGVTRVTTIDALAEEERASDHSMDDMCRICHGGDSLSQDLGQLISACACRGTVGRVHVKCLERWLTESGKSRCELCGTRYATRRVHRYGVPKALIMWILSQNAKQLMVDSLGIMLMSPLAVLAAWLSGRTLAGLMTQDNHTTTPWPLASTFVLACMTLVCYYCWIVSAATRHALGWWIWYRSQYEVRLTIQENE